MMTTVSYSIAMLLYGASAILGSYLLYRLVLRRLGTVSGHISGGLVAGVLLVPSYAANDASTLAPALITAVFNLLFAGGVEAAAPALIMLAVGVTVGSLTGFFRGRYVKASQR